MNQRFVLQKLKTSITAAVLAMLFTLGVGNIAMAGSPIPLPPTPVPTVSISNMPLTLVDPAHPQVLLAITNSESMDGNLSGAIMTGSGESAVDAQLNGSSSPLQFTIPAGFTPPVTGGFSPGQVAYTASSATKCNANVAVLCDNSPSRLNVAKASIQAVLQNYMATTDFGLLTFKTSGLTQYNTWLYVMSDPLVSSGWFSFSTTNTSPPNNDEYINNPCYGATSGDTVYNDCIAMLPELAVSLAALFTDPYMLVQYSSDDPSINDILYAPSGYQPPVCLVYSGPSPANPYPPNFSLSQYENGGILESYSSKLPSSSSCATATGPTNAGFVPYQPQVMYMQRGFGYYSTATAGQGYINTSMGVNGMVSSGDNPLYPIVESAINKFTAYLMPETNSTSTTEIKAQAVQSPVAGMLKTVVSYTWAPSDNGCTPQHYVVMITTVCPPWTWLATCGRPWAARPPLVTA